MKEKLKDLAAGVCGLGLAVCWLTALVLATAALPAAAWKFLLWAWNL